MPSWHITHLSQAHAGAGLVSARCRRMASRARAWCCRSSSRDYYFRTPLGCSPRRREGRWLREDARTGDECSRDAIAAFRFAMRASRSMRRPRRTGPSVHRCCALAPSLRAEIFGREDVAPGAAVPPSHAVVCAAHRLRCDIRLMRGCGLESAHGAGRSDQVDLGAAITPAPAHVFRCASKNATILRRASCADGS